MSDEVDGSDSGFRSGFVSLVGRPNVGKSTLLNQLVGSKVSIVSARPQTTRSQVRGVRTTPDAQIVFLDTPGIHRPRTLLGERTNAVARAALGEVDLVGFVVAADEAVGPGDRFVAGLLTDLATPVVAVVNKTDHATRDEVARQLVALDGLGDFDAYVPVSAHTGSGCEALVGEILARLPHGPRYYPDGMVTDQPEAVLVAERLREQLLHGARDELPHSIAVVVEDVEERETASGEPLLAIRATVLVERPSQRGIVIGRGGEGLKRAGRAARLELETLLGTRIHLETRVRVERDWQRRAPALDRLGFRLDPGA